MAEPLGLRPGIPQLAEQMGGQRMVDDLKAWESDKPEGAPNLLVVSTGEAERNRAQGIQSTLLLDQGFNELKPPNAATSGRQWGATRATTVASCWRASAPSRCACWVSTTHTPSASGS